MDKIQKPAFDVDDRVLITMEHELAGNLGRLILESDTPNPALLALGHQLTKVRKEVKSKKETDL